MCTFFLSIKVLSGYAEFLYYQYNCSLYLYIFYYIQLLEIYPYNGPDSTSVYCSNSTCIILTSFYHISLYHLIMILLMFIFTTIIHITLQCFFCYLFILSLCLLISTGNTYILYFIFLLIYNTFLCFFAPMVHCP